MNAETQLAELGARLAEIGIKNSASAIFSKIQAVRAKRDDEAAIGEPLAILLQKAIASKVPTDPQSKLEYDKLLVILNTEALRVAQDKDASDRLERLRSKGIL